MPESPAADTAPAAQTLVVGLGAIRYRVERPWARMPEGIAIGPLTDVAVDSRGHVHVYHRCDALVDGIATPPVLVFDPRGDFVRAWGAGWIKDPHHLYIDRDDRVFLVDRDAHQVRVFDRDGGHLFDLGRRDEPSAPFNHPTSVATGPDGDIYVADGYGGRQVHRFSPQGAHLASWGEAGDGPGQFSTPHGVRVLADGRVLVGDRENDRVQVFDPQGRHLMDLRHVYRPMAVHVEADGTILVSDQVPRLSAFAPDGRLLAGCRPVLNGGHGLAGDAAGNLYLSEMHPNRITRLTRL